MTHQQFDVVIIGGGAAGLFCALQAGKRGRRTLLIEHSDRVGKKILISGGGRCNFTNTLTSPESFISENPHFCKSALARYTPADFISLVEKHGIAYHEKKLGQLFCDGSARQIVDLLLDECKTSSVEIRCSCTVQQVKKEDTFLLDTTLGAISCNALVIASGGLSIAPLGASDFGYRLARQFGIRVVEPRPGLVPFTLNAGTQDSLSILSGISIDGEVACREATFRENVLITHRGLSGPAVLQVSSYWKPGEAITIDLLPGVDVGEIFAAHRQSQVELATLLSNYLPKRFARAWCRLYASSKPINQYPTAELSRIAEALHQLTITPSGTEGFRKAEVTVGGVSTSELSSKSMEAKKVKELYFIGEVVDVTGHLGGYNFQWAWASAYAASQFV